MKHRASLFLIVIGIVCMILFRRWRSVKEGFVVCNLDQYYTNTMTGAVCVQCPIPYYWCDGNYAYACPANNASCSSTGFTCKTGYTKTATACTCTGYGTTSCTACPTNATCTGGATFTCKAGYYSNAGVCTACPTNSTCASGGTAATTTGLTSFTCKAGFSNTGTECVACPPGYACPGSTNTQCTNNTYSQGSAETCSNCTTGFYSLAGAASCTACPTNALSCTPTSLICNSNYFSNAGACTACPSNSTCALGGGNNTTGLTGIVCQPGYSYPTSTPPDLTRCVKTNYASNLPKYSQGTNQQLADSMPYLYNNGLSSNKTGCDTTNPPCQYNWSGSIGPASSNPCPAKNSWYDWEQQGCVDGLRNPVDVMNPCGSNTVYNLNTNACLTVRVPFAQQPPNTNGSPSLGDFSNCKTTDKGDCTPYYFNGTTMTTTNPCTAPSQYNFTTRSCGMTAAATQASNCCGLPASNLAITPGCSNLVNSSQSYTIIAEKCPPGTTERCCGETMKTNSQCTSYWTASPSYATNSSYNTLCSAGFQDYNNAIDTMATKRLEWLQRRQLINA